MSLMKSQNAPPPLETVLDGVRKACVDYLPLALEAQVEKTRQMYQADPISAVNELKKLKNRKHAREGMALKRRQDKAAEAERDRLKATLDAAAAVVLIGQQQDESQKQRYKEWLDQGHSPVDIATYESEQDSAVLFNDAYDQIRRGSIDFDITDLAHWQIEFSEVRAKYEHLRLMRRSGFTPERKQLLNPLWRGMAGQLVDFRLAAIEKFLADSGITNLWRPEEHDTDCYGQPRPWQSCRFVPVEQKAEPPTTEPRRVPLTITPPSMIPPEPPDISKTEFILDGVKISLPSFPSSRM